MQPPKKILIIRFSSIGDIVLTTPVIRCLKQQLAGVEIHYLTKRQYLPLLKENPFIDKIHLIDDKVSEVLNDLKSENYDFIVDLHKNLRSSQVKMSLNAESGTFNKLNAKKWLLTNLKINLLPKIHIVDRYFDAVKKLQVNNDGQGLDYFIPDVEKVSIPDCFPIDLEKGYMVMVVGSKQQTKQIPVKKMIEICDGSEMPMVLLGDKNDAVKAEQVCEKSGNKVFNACGIFSINQSASVVQQAKVIITPDTGLMHIAAALRKKIISVWGNTVPDFGMYPYFPAGKESYHIVEVNGLRCRPCSKLGYDECPKKHFRCMMDINVAEILKLAAD